MSAIRESHTTEHQIDKEDVKPLKRQHPEGELFVIDTLDVIIKDDMPSMEFPFYSLSKKPDREVRRYEYKDRWIEFRPSIKGLPTIYDKDLIIYVISHVVSAFEEGKPLPQEVEINPYSFFKFTRRGTGGRDYDALKDSLDRLDGTRFRTNVTANGKMIDEWQGLIDRASLKTNEVTGKLESLRIKLSDMVLNTISEREVLTLNRDYFRLKKPIERRIYELARKHVGQKKEWEVFLDTLHKKSGSRSSLKEFRRSIKSLIKSNCLPDYHIEFDSEADKIIFKSRDGFLRAIEVGYGDDNGLPPLSPWAIEKARKAAPRMDIYALEVEWRKMWREMGSKDLENHNAAFIGFCKSYYSKTNSGSEK